jgi:hypothetical protein
MPYGVIKQESVMDVPPWFVAVLQRSIKIKIAHKEPILIFLNLMPSQPSDEL